MDLLFRAKKAYEHSQQNKKIVKSDFRSNHAFEKRVNEKDLPFFINLMRNLYKFDFKCPRPIKNNDQNYITHIHGKNAAVVTFINGSSKKTLSPQNCYEVGVETAKLHLITKNMKINRDNSLSIKSWPKLFDRIKLDTDELAKVELQPKFEGRQIIMVLAPK